MTQLAEPGLLELDRLEFIGAPFDPSRWGLGGAEPVDAPARQAAELASAEVLEALEAVVRDIRASVAAAHASALDAQLRLQYRMAAAALPVGYPGRAAPESAAQRPCEQTRARA